jgi:hypothetical protein
LGYVEAKALVKENKMQIHGIMVLRENGKHVKRRSCARNYQNMTPFPHFGENDSRVPSLHALMICKRATISEGL